MVHGPDRQSALQELKGTRAGQAEKQPCKALRWQDRSIMSLDDLRSQLASMPSVDELVDYDLSCRNIVDDTPDRDTLRRLIDDADETVAFNALLAELSLLWRDRDFAQYRAQVESVRGRWRQDERTRGLFLGLEAQACSSSTNEHALRTGLGYARNSLEYLPSRPKLLNIFANTRRYARPSCPLARRSR